MDFKLSKYLVSSKFNKDSLAKIDRTILFSTRTRKGLIVTNFLIEKIKQKKIEEIPNNVFLKLCEYEIIVLDTEDELDIVLERKKAFFEDQKECNFFIDFSYLKDESFFGALNQVVQLCKYEYITIIFYLNPGTSFSEGIFKSSHSNIRNIFDGKLSNYRLMISMNLFDVDYYSLSIVIDEIDYLELNVEDDQLNRKESVSKIIEFIKGKKCSITFRIFLNTTFTEVVVNFIESVATKNEKLSILFCRGNLDRNEYNKTELKLLTKLIDVGISNALIPAFNPGLYEPSSGFGITYHTWPIDHLHTNGDLKFFKVSQEDILTLKNEESPCLSCSILPLCGVRKIVWTLFGEVICPSYRDNLGERATLLYHKKNN